MSINLKKLSNGFSMPEFGLGTWQMGGRTEQDPDNDDAKDIKAIQKAIELGITHIDTAEIYANGHAEELVAKAVNGYDRSKLFVTSKVLPIHFHYDDVIKSCEQSLKRLQMDYVDLYLLHMYSQDIPLEETMRAMDYLVEQGMVRNIGVSNFGVKHMSEADSYSKNKIVCNQVHYNLIYREPEIRDKLLEYCQNNDILLSAWRPIEKGQIINNPADILLELAKKYDKTPTQIAINWLISQKNVITLSKTSNLEHLRENIGATGWYLDDEDIERLRKEFPDQEEQSNIWPLA